MNEKNEKIIRIVPFREYEELNDVEWIATKYEDVKSCIAGLMKHDSDSIEIDKKKMLSLKELSEIQEQHGNIVLKKLMNLKFCLDCGLWKDYSNFYVKRIVRKGIVKKGYNTYCKDCYYKRNKKSHKKWYGKKENKEKKRIYAKKKRDSEEYEYY